MTIRFQRGLSVALLVNYILLGVTFMSEVSMSLRLFQQAITLLLLGAWLLSLWRSRRPFPGTPLNLPLLILGLKWVAAALQARDPRVSLEYTWPTLAYILGFFLLVDVMRRGRQRWIMDGLFIVSAVVILISLLEMAAWYFGLPTLPWFAQGWPEIGGLTLPPSRHKVFIALNVSTMLGNFCATVAPLAVTWALTARRRDLRFGLWMLAFGLGLTVLLSGSRGALLALIISSSVIALAGLLRDDIRARLPRPLQPFLRPRILLGAALLGGIVVVGGLLWMTLNRPLNSGDTNRLDLWRSAMAMTRDHPVLGVGPYQYGAELRRYGDPDQALNQDRLVHAHNLPLHTLAEGGILGLTAVTWVIFSGLRAWLRAWKCAAPGHRRRLEGGLAAILGFGVHNLVDTFTHTALLTPILIIAAYTVAGHVTRAEALRANSAPFSARQRAQIGGLLALLIVVQTALIPVHVGNLAHGRALRALGSGELEDALAATRTAHAADPALALYPIQEAYVLGLLASRDPGQYLAPAITAHEHALALDPTWDLGWHNLAALYAGSGQFQAAVHAQRSAITWNPVPGGYHLRLGEYLEWLGEDDAARQAAYIEALRRQPALASSGFWTDPAHPDRAAIVEQAISHIAEHHSPLTALQVATYSPHPEAGIPVAAMLDSGQIASRTALSIRGIWEASLNDERLASCPACTLDAAGAAGNGLNWLEYTALARLALVQGDSPARAETLARTALFMNHAAVENYYVLAQVAESAGAPDETVNSLLARAVPPGMKDTNFPMFVYGRSAPFMLLPQARYPQHPHQQLQAWVELAERYAASGAIDAAQRIYTLILERDPYFWEIRRRLAALPAAG